MSLSEVAYQSGYNSTEFLTDIPKMSITDFYYRLSRIVDAQVFLQPQLVPQTVQSVSIVKSSLSKRS